MNLINAAFKILHIGLVNPIWLNNTHTHTKVPNANVKVFHPRLSTVSDYVFMQQLINDGYYSWISLFLGRLSFSVEAQITTREEQKGKENKDERWCRAWLPEFIRRHMWAGLYLEDERWVVCFPGFLPVLASPYSDSRSSRLPRKDGTLSSQFMKHSGWFVWTVCDK